MDRLRIGVVGVGHLGRHHARILAGLEGARLVGVADCRIEQARAVAGPLGVRAFRDHRDLLDEVDAVSIAVPTTLHRAIAGDFLERGIPTLVEKPLAASLKEAEELVSLAKAGQAPLQVGHIERFNPALRALEGMALRPKYVSADRMGTYTFRSTDIGVVLDLMIHDIDVLLSLVRTPVRCVSAVGVSLFGGHEDVANARIEFEDGCVANLTASRASYQAQRRMRIWSAEAYATLDFATRQTTIIRPSERLRHGDLELDSLDISQPAAVREHLFGKVLRVDHVAPEESRDALTLELEEFLRVARRECQPRVPGADALRALRVADQVLLSLSLHQWEGRPDGPVGPKAGFAPTPIANLPAPKSWRYRPTRSEAPRS
jgi:predicted dehydrogenase